MSVIVRDAPAVATASATSVLERRMGIRSARGGNEAYLDGLRGLSVLLIVVLHCWGQAAYMRFDVAGFDLTFVVAGFVVGVDLFFLLSGFLLARPWFEAEAAGAPRPSITKFWRRRIARIAPAYYVSIIAVLVVFTPRAKVPAEALEGRIGLEYLGAHLLFAQGYVPLATTNFNNVNGALWTLSVEMTWYAILPVCALAFLGKRWRVAIPLALGIALTWLYLAQNSLGPLVRLMAGSVDADKAQLIALTVAPQLWFRMVLELAIPSFALTFALGVGLAKLVVVDRNRAIGTSMPWWRVPAVGVVATIAGTIGALVVSWAAFEALLDRPHASVAFGPCLALILFGLTFGPPVLRRPFEWLPMRFLGWISYGVYLIHLPILVGVVWLLGTADWRPGLAFPLLIVSTIAISGVLGTLSWLFVERPFLSPGDQFVRFGGRQIPFRIAIATGIATCGIVVYALAVLTA